MPLQMDSKMMELTLSPAESGAFIAEKAKEIVIHGDKCEDVARMILNAVVDGTIGDIDYKANPLHPAGLTLEQMLNWVFVLDTLNFSFWPDKGEHYDVTYKGKKETGYLACCAAFCKAHEAGVPITSAVWMATCTEGDLNDILRSDSGHPIPLLQDRVQVLRESGDHLMKKFAGQMINMVRASGGRAQTLLRYILMIESFRDMGVYIRQKVSFLKRAQILISDVHGLLKDTEHADLVAFPDLNTLTMFADYRVPQALCYLGCLQYSDHLTATLQSGTELPSGDPLEAELRGCSIHAVQKIYEEVVQLRAEGYKDHNWAETRAIHATDIDVYLWQYRRDHAEAVESHVPFHRTRSVYY